MVDEHNNVLNHQGCQ